MFAVLAALALAACNTAGGGPVAGLFGAADKESAPDRKLTAADFVLSYCPPIEIREGTEALPVYDRGHDGDPAFVRHQASIGKTARECHSAGDVLTMKIGVSGGVVGGPKASAAKVMLPIRIAVIKRSGGSVKPLYSKLFKVPSAIAAPAFRGDFALVQEFSLTLGPNDRDLVVYVGFDDGKTS